MATKWSLRMVRARSTGLSSDKPSTVLPFAQTGNLPRGPHFHDLFCVNCFYLYSRRINYRQKVDDLSSEPESPSNIRNFSYPITALCWLRGNQRADCLQVLFDSVSLVLVEY